MAARLGEVGDAIVTGRVEPEGQGIVLTVKTADEPAMYTAPLLDGDVLFPPNMGFAVRLLERVGWLDEHPSLATAGEDNEWAHRALRAGVRIVYDPTIAVGHLARHRPEDLPGLYRRYARGQGAFYGTWLRRGDRLHCMPGGARSSSGPRGSCCVGSPLETSSSCRWAEGRSPGWCRASWPVCEIAVCESNDNRRAEGCPVFAEDFSMRLSVITPNFNPSPCPGAGA